MQKSAPSVGRILVMVGFGLSCFGLLLFLWLAFGGPVPLKAKGYRITVPFRAAGQLAQEADVRISGVTVGKVKTITSDKRTGYSDATIELDRRYAPMPKDTRAILRQKTLLGETYVALTPGTRSSGSIPDGGRLPTMQVASSVQLDEIFRAFDAKTRAAFRDWMQQQALAVTGRGRDLNDALGNLRPFTEDTAVLLQILNGQQPTIRSLIRDSGTVFDALSERDSQLRGLVANSNRVFATTAQRDRELRETFLALPTFERESRITLDRLTAFAKDANPLVTQLRPAARELSPTLNDLAVLSPDLKRLFRDLNPAITASEAGLPALTKFTDELRPALGELDPPLRQIAPPLEGLGQYKNELTAFFANSAAATQATAKAPDGRLLHYLRTTNPLVPENLAIYPRRLPTNRTNPYIWPQFYKDLPTGMQSYETRQCVRGGLLPAVSPQTAPFLPAGLRDDLETLAFGGAARTVPAPPCKQQPPFPVFGVSTPTTYPHVRANQRLVGGPFSPRPTTPAPAASHP